MYEIVNGAGGGGFLSGGNTPPTSVNGLFCCSLLTVHSMQPCELDGRGILFSTPHPHTHYMKYRISPILNVALEIHNACVEFGVASSGYFQYKAFLKQLRTPVCGICTWTPHISAEQ